MSIFHCRCADAPYCAQRHAKYAAILAAIAALGQVTVLILLLLTR